MLMQNLGGQTKSIDGNSPDVTAAMFVYRTIEKKVFREFDSIFMQNMSLICYCFVHKHGRLITWFKTIFYGIFWCGLCWFQRLSTRGFSWWLNITVIWRSQFTAMNQTCQHVRDFRKSLFLLKCWSWQSNLASTLLAEPFLTRREREDAPEIVLSLYWICASRCLETVSNPGQVSLALMTPCWFSYWRLDFDLRLVKSKMRALPKPVWPEWLAQKVGLRRPKRLNTFSGERLFLALWRVFERVCPQDV